MALISRVVVAAAAISFAACGGRVAGDGSETGDGRAAGSAGANGGDVSTGGALGRAGDSASGATGGRGRGGSPSTGGVVSGSCNPAFCQPGNDGKGCCFGPNGPCGVDFGNGCMNPECRADTDCMNVSIPCSPCENGECAPASSYCKLGICYSEIRPCPEPACAPERCMPGPPGSKPCCTGPNGSCGVDFGSGCGLIQGCSADSDCAPIPAPCVPCPGPAPWGYCAPQVTRCFGGLCTLVPGSCPMIAG